jgi:hypothetical protein
MTSTDLKSLHIARALAPIAAALVLISLGAMPSFARSDLGTHIPRPDQAAGCKLQRVGTQFVRCDNLTGNGVAAPEWIPLAGSAAVGFGLASGEHRQTNVDIATFDAPVAVVVSDRFTTDSGGTLLPGDVRVWELNHPAGATPALLPGDLRHRERGGPADLSAPAT